jgi:hypothetical protein
MKIDRRFMWALPVMAALHALLCWRLLLVWSSAPVLSVDMSSTVPSHAQVFFDLGSGFNEADSSRTPVSPAGGPQQLRLPLPAGVIRALRFDPIASPGDLVIHRTEVLRRDGSVAAAFPPDRIHEIQQFDLREVQPGGLRLRVSPPNTDPQLRLDLEAPLDLRSSVPGTRAILGAILANLALLLAEGLLLFGLSRRARLPKPGLKAAVLLLVHVLLSACFLHLWSSPPVVEVEMSSSVISRAQVYWDMGEGMSEDRSASQPIRAGTQPQLLRFPLPHGQLRALRFDPLTSPGTIVIRRAAIQRSDGTALPIDLHRIRGVIGFDQMEFEPGGLRFRIRTDSLDPQMAIDLNFPIDLRSAYPGNALLARIAIWNVALFLLEFSLLIWQPGLSRTKSIANGLDTAAGKLAACLSSARFIVFDRLAMWFYTACTALFLLATLADLNGSSIGVLWLNFKAGAPPNVIAGVPQGIRADEIYYQTPYMLNQYFRPHPFELVKTASGGENVGLLAELPVRHVTTWFRPQFWPFFFLPPDYAFAAWWQAKGLIMATGVFTLLLLITGSSPISIIGTLWLLFSQFTQWCYSWPSMLPEMAGLFCFTLVFALYLTVGTNRLALAIAAFAAAAAAIGFALSAYVPHQIPYAWAGILLASAWLIAHRSDILRRDGSIWRIAALIGFVALTAAPLLTVLHDTKAAVSGIASTVYPGQRVLSGGGYSFTTMATHFLAASENANRFPPEYSNINEASGFLWLAPVTLFCFSRMRALSRERRTVLAGLWVAAILLTAWMCLPIPASIGRFLFFDRAQGVRFLPALGLINVFIVMLVLGAPRRRPRLSLDAKVIIALPLSFAALFLANQNVHAYFHISELLLGACWAAVLIALLLDGRRPAFAAAVVIPNILLFALVNPVERGIGVVTATPLFDLVQRNPRLREGKWMVFSKGFPPAIFTSVGCDVFNGMRYLPDRQYFPLLAAHGIDTGAMNNLGYVNIDQLEPGQAPRARFGPYGPILSVSPLDPLLKELGIRYLAFHERPRADVLDHLTPLIDGTVSEFWIYELK